MRSLGLPFFMFASVAMSCALVAAQAFPQPTTDPDAKEIAAYRLTMEGVGRVDRVTRAMIAEIKKDPKWTERIQLESELTGLKKKDEPTESEQKRIEEIEAKVAQLEDAEGNPFSDLKTLSDMEAGIRRFPPLAKTLQQEGMAPREYAKFILAMIQSAFAAGMQKAGMVKDLPQGVSPENVTFVLDHQAELQRLQQAWQALGK